jgi:predicted SAM-dependent methyltransferase
VNLVIGTRRWLGECFTHVDIDPRPLVDPLTRKMHPVDIVCDARTIPLPAGSVDFIFSSQCLEHFRRDDYMDALREWVRLLRTDGLMVVEVPNFEGACRMLLEHGTEERDRKLQQYVFGGQQGEHQYHYVGFTTRMLAADMGELGCRAEFHTGKGAMGLIRMWAWK